jgi:hypothetical protein
MVRRPARLLPNAESRKVQLGMQPVCQKYYRIESATFNRPVFLHAHAIRELHTLALRRLDNDALVANRECNRGDEWFGCDTEIFFATNVPRVLQRL